MLTLKYSRESAFLRDQMGEEVLKLLTTTGAFVAGGAVTSVFSSQRINDFDIFFPDETALNTGLELVSLGEKGIETDSARSVILNGHRVQLIKCVLGDPSKIITGFDFTICQGSFSLNSGFAFGDEFFLHLAQRKLVFNIAAEYPICSLYRARKFIQRGFHFSGIEAIKLGLRIHALTINTYADLRKQLMGIDTLFLKDLTDSLQGDAEKSYDFNQFMETLNDWLVKLDQITGAEEKE